MFISITEYKNNGMQLTAFATLKEANAHAYKFAQDYAYDEVKLGTLKDDVPYQAPEGFRYMSTAMVIEIAVGQTVEIG